jgi:hypothetical protein
VRVHFSTTRCEHARARSPCPSKGTVVGARSRNGRRCLPLPHIEQAQRNKGDNAERNCPLYCCL